MKRRKNFLLLLILKKKLEKERKKNIEKILDEKDFSRTQNKGRISFADKRSETFRQ